MKAVGVVERDCSDVPGGPGPNSFHECEVARSFGGFLARAVGILEVLEGEAFQLRPSNDGVELLAE